VRKRIEGEEGVSEIGDIEQLEQFLNNRTKCKLLFKFHCFKMILYHRPFLDTQIKKSKTEAKASSSFQIKGNKLQFEFNSSLLDSINSSSTHLLEGNLSGVNTELENAKTLLNKRNKVIRLADKSPAGWTAVRRVS